MILQNKQLKLMVCVQAAESACVQNISGLMEICCSVAGVCCMSIQLSHDVWAFV